MIVRIPFQSLAPRFLLPSLQKAGFTEKQFFYFCKKYYRLHRSIDEIKNVDKNMLAFLHQNYTFPTLKIVDCQKDSEGNAKVIFETMDQCKIETVIMEKPETISICVSTQIGCKMGCIFCATGQMGFKRNLESWEIMEQIRLIQTHWLVGKKITHITVMGMGEPFENLEATYDAYLNMIDFMSYSIGAKKVTWATVGYLPGLKKLLEKPILPTLAISLHAPNQALREKIMPSAKNYPLPEIINYIKNFPLKPNKRISIQYLLLKDINDSIEHAKELGELLKDLPVKINFLSYNPIENNQLRPSDENTRNYFIQYIRENYHLSAIRRNSVGKEIKAACGQLGGFIKK